MKCIHASDRMKRIEDAIRIGADYCIKVLLDERADPVATIM